jgi:putative ABC transport system permease protein
MRHRHDRRDEHSGRKFRFDNAGLDRTDVPGGSLHLEQRRPERLHGESDFARDLENHGGSSSRYRREHRPDRGSAASEGATILSGVDLEVMHRLTRLSWMQPPLSDAVFDPERNAGLALVSESFSERFRRQRGDPITVPTPLGEIELSIAGVFSDYGNERGSILVDRRHFAAWFQDEHASGLMVFVRPDFGAEALRAEWLADHPGLRIFSNAHLRSEILRIFRQTFAITYALEVIGVLVAVDRIGPHAGSVLLERRAELTTLRALGLSRSEIAQATACEGLALAVAGVAVGLGVSVALGWMLIYVINKQTFGWTLGFDLPWLQLASLGLLVIGIGTAVAYGVGRWGAHLPADQEE